MYRSKFPKAKPSNHRFQSVTASPPKSVPSEPVKYVSEVTIHLAGNTSETSPRKLSSSKTSPSPQRKVNNNTFTTPEKNNSRESLSTSVRSQLSRKPVEGTPRTSTPEPAQKTVSPRDGQKYDSGFHHENMLSSVESHADRRKPFYDSAATNRVNSTTQDSNAEYTTQQSHRGDYSKKHWYFDILQRMEDLSWSYQNLEVEYSFLEKLMDEQKEDLKKAKSWNQRLRNQKSSATRTSKVY
ncbi:hypothetical protein OS493_023395 [Desmophyllum pertusum]|uniref:Uncharacterized protein n=1 Tax=Desmophyllum pertusum TaxID=174260 RepID=A0A9X0A0P6_9CNID|nr:hypothetical protein OS493_023395 [Desmophyllum pertusum]